MNYTDWNQAIGQHFFRPEYEGQRLFLAVEPSVLQQIAEPFQVFSSGEQAGRDLGKAVREEIIRRDRCWRPKYELDCTNFPCVLAMAALQVFAVYQMCDGEEFTARAYWDRVRELLANDASDYHFHPTGQFYKDHQVLWRKRLERWTNEPAYRSGRTGYIKLPADDQSLRHVRLPWSQALLRLQDLSDLSDLLQQTGLEPGEAVDGSTVAERLETCLRERDAFRELPGFLKQHGMNHRRPNLTLLCRFLRRQGGVSAAMSRHALRVFADARWRAASEQLADFFFQPGRQSPASAASLAAASPPTRRVRRPVRLWLSIRARTGTLGSGLIERTVDEGWDQISGVTVADLVGLGYLGPGRTPDTDRSWRPLYDGIVLAVAGPEYTQEALKARPGDSVLVLIPDSDCGRWLRDSQPLAEKSAGRERVVVWRSEGGAAAQGGRLLRGVPLGWVLLQLTLRQDLKEETVASPSSWAGLIHWDSFIRAEGGLTRRRGVWMAGMGPQLRVVGNPLPAQVLVEGRACPVNPATGLVNVAPEVSLDRPGIHFAWLLNQRRLGVRVMVEAAELSREFSHRAAWRRRTDSWPTSNKPAASLTVDEVRGPALIGNWQSAPLPQGPVAPVARLALELILRQRGLWVLPHTADIVAPENSLLQALATGARRRERPVVSPGAAGDAHA